MFLQVICNIQEYLDIIEIFTWKPYSSTYNIIHIWSLKEIFANLPICLILPIYFSLPSSEVASNLFIRIIFIGLYGWKYYIQNTKSYEIKLLVHLCWVRTNSTGQWRLATLKEVKYTSKLWYKKKTPQVIFLNVHYLLKKWKMVLKIHEIII